MKVVIGIALWALLLGTALYASKLLSDSVYGDIERTYDDMTHFAQSGPTVVQIYFPNYVHLAPSDGLYVKENKDYKRVGEIKRAWVDNEKGGVRIVADLDPKYRQRIHKDTVAESVSGAGSLPWIIETLLPEETMARARSEWDSFRESHLNRLVGSLTPIALEVAKEFPRVLLRDLELSIKQREKQWKGLLEAYREEVLKEAFVPVLEGEVWPIILQHVKPEAETIGKEIWGEVPLWGFAWRGAYDSVFHSDPIHVEEHWQGFLSEKVVPIVEARRGELEAMVGTLIRAIIDNDQVQKTLGTSLLKLRDDRRIHLFLQHVLEDILVKSDAPKIYFLAKLRDPRVRDAFATIENDFENFRIRLGNMIVLNEAKTGINPDFSRFLRTLVMKKDQRWLLLRTEDNFSHDHPPYEADSWLHGLTPLITNR